MPSRRNKELFQQLTEFEWGKDYRPSRRRIFLMRNKSLCAVEQFHSDVSLEVVERRALKNSMNWQWMTEGDVSVRRLTPATHGGSPSRQTIDGCVRNGLMSTQPNKLIGHQVVFSDESHFKLWDHDGRIRVRCYAGERYLPECVIERHSSLTPGVMPEVVPFLQSISGAIFQQDNARPHVAKSVRDFCSSQHMQLLPWPAYSSDMSPIEHV
ncbi:uncharacterized protein TNCV_1018941 [Trichonephila clavipes]|nr:uncharacterized protein TNCV_1018941 [Trichonephila clavipes]